MPASSSPPATSIARAPEGVLSPPTRIRSRGSRGPPLPCRHRGHRSHRRHRSQRRQRPASRSRSSRRRAGGPSSRASAELTRHHLRPSAEGPAASARELLYVLRRPPGCGRALPPTDVRSALSRQGRRVGEADAPADRAPSHSCAAGDRRPGDPRAAGRSPGRRHLRWRFRLLAARAPAALLRPRAVPGRGAAAGPVRDGAAAGRDRRRRRRPAARARDRLAARAVAAAPAARTELRPPKPRRPRLPSHRRRPRLRACRVRARFRALAGGAACRGCGSPALDPAGRDARRRLVGVAVRRRRDPGVAGARGSGRQSHRARGRGRRLARGGASSGAGAGARAAARARARRSGGRGAPPALDLGARGAAALGPAQGRAAPALVRLRRRAARRRGCAPLDPRSRREGAGRAATTAPKPPPLPACSRSGRVRFRPIAARARPAWSSPLRRYPMSCGSSSWRAGRSRPRAGRSSPPERPRSASRAASTGSSSKAASSSATSGYRCRSSSRRCGPARAWSSSATAATDSCPRPGW